VAGATDPQARQALDDLAYVLGQSHALRQTCRGTHDQYWRAKMLSLMQLEAASDPRMAARLSRAFNAGFDTERASHPVCAAAALQEAARQAERGRVLAITLASSDPPRPGERG
jgi:uncharacterized protein (TIGR02301 family)